MKVIIINGSASVGKDKFVSYVKQAGNFKIENLSSIDRVKQIAESSFGWNGKKNEKSRKMLSEMKKIWTDFNNGPFNIITSKIEEDLMWRIDNGKNNDKNIYFVHVREPEEILKFKNFYGDDCLTLLLVKSVDVPNNSSDLNVSNYKYDIIIDNNGTEEELELKANEFIKYLS